MPVPRQGSRTVPEGPGRAGSDRQRPPPPALLPPGRSNSGGGPAGAPAARGVVKDALRPTREGVAPQPQHSLPRGLRARCQSHHPAASPKPSQALWSQLPSPGPSASAAALVRARPQQSRLRPQTGREASCGCPSQAAAPSRPRPRPGTTCWDGSPGGGSSKSIMLS